MLPHRSVSITGSSSFRKSCSSKRSGPKGTDRKRLKKKRCGGLFDEASDEEIVSALCHDIGKTMSVPNHGAIAAELLKPYVSDDLYHTIKWHQDFQGAYYYNYMGKPTTLREDHKDESWYPLACKLVDDWDAPAFDPDFEVDSLESFEPEIVRVFSTPKMM